MIIKSGYKSGYKKEDGLRNVLKMLISINIIKLLILLF